MSTKGVMLACFVLLIGRGSSAQCQLFEYANGSERVEMDGRRLVSSSENEIFVYERSGANWFLEHSFTPSFAGGPALLQFPSAVDIEGDTLVLANSLRDCVGIYELSGGNWNQVWSVCLPGTFDGVGAVALDDHRVAYFRFDSNVRSVRVIEDSTAGWGEAFIVPKPASASSGYGTDLALEGDTLFVADTAGVVYVHVFDGVGWPVLQILTATPSLIDFPSTVSVSGTLAVVGAPRTPPGGAVATYERIGGLWQPAGVVQPSATQAGMLFRGSG